MKIKALKVSAKYCYATHQLRLHQNDRCKRFTLFSSDSSLSQSRSMGQAAPAVHLTFYHLVVVIRDMSDIYRYSDHSLPCRQPLYTTIALAVAPFGLALNSQVPPADSEWSDCILAEIVG